MIQEVAQEVGVMRQNHPYEVGGVEAVGGRLPGKDIGRREGRVGQ